MSYYPIVAMPKAIAEAKSALPSIKEFSEVRPEEPVRPKKINYTLLGVEAAIATSAVPLFSYIWHLPFWQLLAIEFGAIALQAYAQIKSFPNRIKQYELEHNKFTEVLKSYARRRYEHEQSNKLIRSPENVAKFRQERILSILQNTRSHDRNGSDALIGKSEKYFGKYLFSYFKDKIHTQLVVQNPNYDDGYHYTPDFAYIDDQIKLYIDIEIDEPYSGSKPLHYLERQSQQTRDTHFRSLGWIVIRFAEEQVVRQPESCCKVIADAIATITGERPLIFTNTPDLRQVRCWNKAEAEEMARNKYRNTYLGLLN